MAHFLFVDESGHDLSQSPCAVLAGVSVEDRDLWNLINAIKALEIEHFGLQYSQHKEEFKAKKFLKRKVFRLAGQLVPLPAGERQELAREIILDGTEVTLRRLTALAQAKLAFVEAVLDLLARFRCNLFASIVNRGAPRPAPGLLRKDYVFLFERFYYFLDDLRFPAQGFVVFDELERVLSKILIGQMKRYFQGTAVGRLRATRIVPEPFFVHSDLTTMIQVADFAAYILAWGYRRSRKAAVERRSELEPYASRLHALGYQTERERAGNPHFRIWSIATIDDLRGRSDRRNEKRQ